MYKRNRPKKEKLNWEKLEHGPRGCYKQTKKWINANFEWFAVIWFNELVDNSLFNDSFYPETNIVIFFLICCYGNFDWWF